MEDEDHESRPCTFCDVPYPRTRWMRWTCSAHARARYFSVEHPQYCGKCVQKMNSSKEHSTPIPDLRPVVSHNSPYTNNKPLPPTDLMTKAEVDGSEFLWTWASKYPGRLEVKDLRRMLLDPRIVPHGDRRLVMLGFLTRSRREFERMDERKKKNNGILPAYLLRQYQRLQHCRKIGTGIIQVMSSRDGLSPSMMTVLRAWDMDEQKNKKCVDRRATRTLLLCLQRSHTAMYNGIRPMSKGRLRVYMGKFMVPLKVTFAPPTNHSLGGATTDCGFLLDLVAGAEDVHRYVCRHGMRGSIVNRHFTDMVAWVLCDANGSCCHRLIVGLKQLVTLLSSFPPTPKVGWEKGSWQERTYCAHILPWKDRAKAKLVHEHSWMMRKTLKAVEDKKSVPRSLPSPERTKRPRSSAPVDVEPNEKKKKQRLRRRLTDQMEQQQLCTRVRFG